MHAMRIACTGITQSQKMQYDVVKTVSTFPEVAFVYSKTGTAELASDPMPPNVSDTFIILKDKKEWRSEEQLAKLIAEKTEEMEKMGAHSGGDDGHGHGRGGGRHVHGPPPEGHKGKVIKLLELTLQTVPGNNYEFTQPIQMRFNELISGVRGDVAVKVYGDDFASMQKPAASVLATLQSVPGAADAKVEQTEGLPVNGLSSEMVSKYCPQVVDKLFPV